MTNILFRFFFTFPGKNGPPYKRTDSEKEQQVQTNTQELKHNSVSTLSFTLNKTNSEVCAYTTVYGGYAKKGGH